MVSPGASPAVRRLAALTLYRRILKAHGSGVLSPAQRSLGDKYVKTEWRRHMRVSPEVASAFYAEWFHYLEHLSNHRGAQSGGVGRHLTDEETALLSEDQRKKLAEIRSQAQ
eukprot:Hpha_TRINITY_DN7410_c0_g1::TRINITY_DN7410_c0_g1_i1::g.95895::m.95895